MYYTAGQSKYKHDYCHCRYRCCQASACRNDNIIIIIVIITFITEDIATPNWYSVTFIVVFPTDFLNRFVTSAQVVQSSFNITSLI